MRRPPHSRKCLGRPATSARIIDRGRGPEIEGTRITVYAIMDYVREGDPAEVIAASLRLTREQVHVALAYIQAHRDEVNRVYEQLLHRDQQGNPAWVDALRARTREDLEERIRQRRAEGSARRLEAAATRRAHATARASG